MQPCEQEINVKKTKNEPCEQEINVTKKHVIIFWIGSVCKYIHHTGLVNDVMLKLTS